METLPPGKCVAPFRLLITKEAEWLSAYMVGWQPEDERILLGRILYGLTVIEADRRNTEYLKRWSNLMEELFIASMAEACGTKIESIGNMPRVPSQQ